MRTAFTAMQPINNKSAFAKNAYRCIRYHTPESKIPGINIPIPKPINTEFLSSANLFFIIIVNQVKGRLVPLFA